MNKSTAVLVALLAFFVGVVGGFTVSPVKKGINIKIDVGNNSGNKNIYKDKNEKTKPDTAEKTLQTTHTKKKGEGKRKWIGRK
ncbi:MAG: hypothetical protein IJ192_07925 [Clostridia bacterium]|nr:hypothetical protein [Clostridia bacterium]